jgi:hypothetical protein
VMKPVSTRRVRALAPQREPPVAFAFGLFSGLLALLFMRALGTPQLDMDAYRMGVGIAAGAGGLTALGVGLVRPYPRFRRASLLFIVFVGALVGMAMQWILLVRAPSYRTYILSTGLTTAEPSSWILAGGALGALPAAAAAGFFAGVQRLFANARAHDARERMMMPFAAVCALLGSMALGAAQTDELLLVVGVITLAVIALAEIFVSDLLRARWLHRVFASGESSYEVVPFEGELDACDLPLVIGAVAPRAVIVQVGEERGYRAAARTPIAATGATETEALAPLRRRRIALLAVGALTSVSSVVALVGR